MVKKGPTLRAQWLGKQLKEHRDRAGLTMRQAGEYLQRDQGTISRIESGLIPCRAADAMALLNLYRVDDLRIREGIDRLARDVWCKGWWDDYASEAETKIIDHAWLEARAEGIRLFHTTVFPGLLQTEGYIRAVMGATAPEAPPEQVDLWTRFRMNRQRVLDREKPLHLSVVLDESVLYRGPGGREAMRDQLLHVRTMAERPAVTIQILPFSAGLHASPENSFTILDMADPYPYLAQVETRTGAVYLEGKDVEAYEQAYIRLQAMALSPEESGALICSVADGLRQERK